MNIFKGKWIIPAEFENLTTIDVFHREHEKPKFSKDEHPENLKNIHMIAVSEFALGENFGKVTVKITADDYFKLYINGKFAGQGPTPGYYFRYNWNEIDITEFVHSGANEIRADVYYQGLINRVWNSGDLRIGMICDVTAAEKVILSTDENWKYTISQNYISRRTIGYDTQFLEDYDARIPLPPFRSVSVNEHTDYTFAPEPQPMLDIYEIKPAITEKLAENMIFFDFGHEITATLNISAAGKDGDTITVLCGEETDDSEFKTRFKMRCNCEYLETITLADGENRICQYDYKAFRYVTLILSEGVSLTEITATVRHAPFDDKKCVIESSDKTLESVFEICKNGVKFGSQEVFVDCPSREKGQYAGDCTVTSASYTWLTGDVRMLRKAIENQAQSCFIDDGIMAVAPGSLMQEIADYSLQFPLLLLKYYEFTSNKKFLCRMLPVCEKMLAYFNKYSREDGLLDGVSGKWNLVDWPANLRDNYDFDLQKPIGAGCHNVINAFYVGAVGNVEKIKDILGIPHSDEYSRLSETFNRVFFDYSKGVYVDSEGSSHSSLHANIIAPFYGFHPCGYDDKIADFIVEKGLCCGVYMSYFLLKSLCRLNRHNDAYNFIVSKAENSWYNMIREGGTTCFEAWGKDKKANTSLCHPWASAPISVIIEDILGLNPDGTRCENHVPENVTIKAKIPCHGILIF